MLYFLAGAEINLPWYAQHGDMFAPWDKAPAAILYPGEKTPCFVFLSVVKCDDLPRQARDKNVRNNCIKKGHFHAGPFDYRGVETDGTTSMMAHFIAYVRGAANMSLLWH